MTINFIYFNSKRTEEEYELFQRMDIERRRLEASNPNRKPRLMEESELPGWLLRDDAELDKMRAENEAKDNFGEGQRQRKEVDYSDRLTEREFLMAVDEGKLDEVVEAKRARHAQRKAEGFEDDEELEEEEDEEEEVKPSKRAPVSGGGRKRGRPSAAQSAAMLADASFTRPGLDRKKEKSFKVDKKLLKKMKFLVNCVIKYKDTYVNLY